MAGTILVRYGELALKSERVRRGFERRLIGNIRAALEGIAHGLKRERGRIFVETSSTEAAIERLVRVPGVVSVSPALRTSATLEAMTSTALRVAREVLKPGMSFAVRTRRTGEHEFTSRDVDVAVGSAILEEIPGVKVDLSSPSKEISIEVRGKDAYVYTEVLRGPGGLPLSTQGTVVALLSGGMDSPVAAWLMMKRGCRVVLVHLDAKPYSDAKALAIEAARSLSGWAAGVGMVLYVVPYGEVLRAIVERAPRRLVCVLCKRGMYKAAEMVAAREGALGLVTGEVLGQVVSQTLANLRVLDAAVSLPVFRPLLGLDKVEVEGIARRLGTYEISTKLAAPCRAAPKRPETRADLNRVLEAERKLGLEPLLEGALRRAERISF
jgi:thiamine biosynthesis protein ThiI